MDAAVLAVNHRFSINRDVCERCGRTALEIVEHRLECISAARRWLRAYRGVVPRAGALISLFSWHTNRPSALGTTSEPATAHPSPKRSLLACKHATAALALSLFLSACSSSPSAPPYTPPPPVQAPVLFQADLTGPSLNLGLACHGPGVGLDCSTLDPSYTWGTEGQPQIMPCVEPGPNRCYSLDGTLHFDSHDNGGWFAILAKSYPKDSPLLLECALSADLANEYGYAGCVLYNGEGNYRALYIDGAGYTIYMTTITVHLGKATPGPHTLGLGYDGKGTWQYFVDGVLRQTETPGSISPDSTVLANDPHPAFWNGFATGTLSRFTLYGPR